MTCPECEKKDAEIGKLATELARAVGLMKQMQKAINSLERAYRQRVEDKEMALMLQRVDNTLHTAFNDVVKELEPILHIPEVRDLLWGTHDRQP